MKRLYFVSILFLFGTLSYPIWSCTNFLVGKNASVDGSTFISYAADSYYLYGALYHFPAALHAEGDMLDIYEWDSGKYLGQIKQAPQTFNVIGNMNEHQLAIGETTFGGHKELHDPEGLMDYGSLMYIALQRAKTAREAISVITGLVEEYGYYSEGESFSIADSNEAWILEMIGKGPGRKGAVWVALRLPDDCVSAHANQARITHIPFEDRENCMYSPDVISFAREKGYFSGKDEEFSFSDVYNPLDYAGLRICEARVWSFFKDVNRDMDEYISYIKGDSKKCMPLWIKPDRKLGLEDLKRMMRDHYEGTELDMTQGVAAGEYGSKVRYSPLTFDVDGVTYGHERPIATQQTGFSFIAQMRSWLPNHIGGILWFGVDDAASNVYMPVYCCTNEVPWAYDEKNGDLLEYSPTSAFWTFNLVSNLAYGKYRLMMEDIRMKQQEIEKNFSREVLDIDQEALFMKEDDARKFLADYSVNALNSTNYSWKRLGEYLLVKYLDGTIKRERSGKFVRDKYGLPDNIIRPGYSDEMKREMVRENPGLRHKTESEMRSRDSGQQ